MRTQKETLALGRKILEQIKARVTSSEDIIPKYQFPFYDPRFESSYLLRFGKKFSDFKKHQQLLIQSRKLFHKLAHENLRHSMITCACIAY